MFRPIVPTSKNNISMVKTVIKPLSNPMICCFYYAVDARSVMFRLTIIMFPFHILSRLSHALRVYDTPYILRYSFEAGCAVLSDSYSKHAYVFVT